MRTLLAVACMLASPAGAQETACREAYQASYESDWRVSRADWDKGCAARERPADILRARQRAFMDACVRRFPPRQGLTTFDIQSQCARGTVGESRLGPPPGQAPEPAPRPRMGEGWRRRLGEARVKARARQADACFAGLLACFACGGENGQPADWWSFLFYSPSTGSRKVSVPFRDPGAVMPVFEPEAPPSCAAEPKVEPAEAIAIALRNGVDEKPGMFVELGLLPVSDARRTVQWDARVYELFPRARGALVWHVSAQGTRVVIDARSGEVVGRY